MGSITDKSPEQRSGEPGTAPSESKRSADLASNAPSQDHPSVDLIPALRLILSSAERIIAPPVGNNEHLARTLWRLHALLGKLTRISDAEFIEALEALASGRERPHREKPDDADPRPLRNLSLDEIELMLSDPKITKKRLLAIVRERFGGSTGTLAKLKREALLERVAALAMNERSHETVARLASGDANRHSSGTTNAATATQVEDKRSQE